MKYKLININTKQEVLCDKVTIDGFDYYVSDEKILTSDYKYHHVTGLRKALVDGNYTNQKKVIATNNPNIDVPKVVDEVTFKVNNHFKDYFKKEDGTEMKGEEISAEMMSGMLCEMSAFIAGYNKSQETHSFSEEDVIEFAIWLNDTDKIVEQTKHIDFSKSDDKEVAKELIQIWKEQHPKTVYYV